MKRRPARFVDVCVFFNQLHAQGGQALEGCQHERTFVLPGTHFDVDFGPAQQNSRHLQRRLANRQHQPMVALFVEGVDVKTAL